MPTKPIDAYLKGIQDRKAHPFHLDWDWEDILPYAIQPLVEAWLDGWRGKSSNGKCVHCWGMDFTDLPDGIMRCKSFYCNRGNYPPVDKSKIDYHLAMRDRGMYI
jgi:hypothetical protein